MYKPTKRYEFKFQRSYFDVLNKIPKDKDKLNFLLAIINKQFLDQDPKELSFVSELSYESQRHFIEKSVKGYKDKMKTDLLGNPITDPTQGGAQGGSQDPSQQEQEQEKEKEQDVNLTKFLSWFNSSKKKHKGVEGKFKTLTKTDINNLKKLRAEYNAKDFEDAFIAMSKSKWVIDNNMLSPNHFLRNDNFNKYLNTEDNKTNKSLAERLKL